MVGIAIGTNKNYNMDARIFFKSPKLTNKILPRHLSYSCYTKLLGNEGGVFTIRRHVSGGKRKLLSVLLTIENG
jgi:hypothetical protein